jgi:hypothetical protein
MKNGVKGKEGIHKGTKWCKKVQKVQDDVKRLEKVQNGVKRYKMVHNGVNRLAFGDSAQPDRSKFGECFVFPVAIFSSTRAET